MKLHDRGWFHGLPFRIKFRRSKLYISIIPPFFISFLIGILASILGVGGGFILVPAMIYILGMSTQVVIGTSLMQVLFVSIVSTIMHAHVNQTVGRNFIWLFIIRRSFWSAGRSIFSAKNIWRSNKNDVRHPHIFFMCFFIFKIIS